MEQFLISTQMLWRSFQSPHSSAQIKPEVASNQNNHCRTMFAVVLHVKTARLICCSVPFPVSCGSLNIPLFANTDPLLNRSLHVTKSTCTQFSECVFFLFFSINRAHVTILEVSIDCRSKIYFSFQITSIVY